MKKNKLSIKKSKKINIAVPSGSAISINVRALPSIKKLKGRSKNVPRVGRNDEYCDADDV